MDGRCQERIGAWCRKEFGVEYPDTITIAGCDGVLTQNPAEYARAMTMARISAEKHGAAHAVVVGHSECAGYPVSDEEHQSAIKESVARIAKEGIFKQVVGLFVYVKSGSITEVCRV